MSVITTYSKFYYGIEVTENNNLIDLNEGGPDLIATLRIGSYTLDSIVVEVARALNEVSVNNWSASVNRTTRVITLSVDVASDILWATGASIAASAGPLLGFDAIDDVGATSFVGTNAVGSSYSPQYLIQDYVPSSNLVQAAFSTVNKSASGRISIQTFGEEKFIEMNLRYITDKYQGAGSIIRNSQTALQDVRDFLSWVTAKKFLQFMPNENDPSNYETLILESTGESQDGTGFRLVELFALNLPYYFETGLLRFRIFEE